MSDFTSEAVEQPCSPLA